MRILLLFLSFAFLISCQKESTGLASYPRVTSTFSAEEVTELQEFLDTFTSLICQKVNQDNADSSACFIAYLQKVSATKNSGKLETFLSSDEINSLLSSMDPSTLREVWMPFMAVVERNTIDTIEIQSLNPDGKYGLFLEKMAEESPQLNSYFLAYNNLRMLSPTMISQILMDWQSLNIKDESIRLVLAVHQVTLSEQLSITRVTKNK